MSQLLRGALAAEEPLAVRLALPLAEIWHMGADERAPPARAHGNTTSQNTTESTNRIA